MNMSHMDNKATCPMIMVFHAGHCERILWRSWIASGVLEFVLSCIAWFFIAFAYEAVKCTRQYLQRRSVQKRAECIALEIEAKRGNDTNPPGCPRATLSLPEFKVKSKENRVFSADHFLQTLLYLIQVIMAYLLMLIVMSFNYWLCLAVILGLGTGYFCFGWTSKNTIIDNECCS